MYGTHALYARSIIYKDDEWQLQTLGDGTPILANVTVEEDGAIRFAMSMKTHCRFHDEMEYQWRVATDDVQRLSEEVATRIKAECDAYAEECAARLELPY